MPVVHVVLANGETRSVAAQNGQSLMQAVVDNSIPGLDAVCGGYCSCATCHVYIDAAWAAQLPPVGEDEDAMLDGALAPRLAESRLSCQITLDDSLDGLKVRIPDEQI